jgi:hypothetical protein
VKLISHEDDVEKRAYQSQNESKRVAILSQNNDVNLGTYQDLRCKSGVICIKKWDDIIGNKAVIYANFT